MAAAGRILNINLGILGHIDSGKTSLAKALSTIASTAAFDKNPQSQERGITLDLGFSSFVVDMPEHLAALPYDRLQFTLVDCPGHASLIRTIIGGAQIIDLMLLVIDVQKGIQTQTAECLVIGEITCDKLIVVINKLDLLPPATRAEQLEKMKSKLNKVFSQTKFRNPPMVAVSANPGGADPGGEAALTGLPELIETLKRTVAQPIRSDAGPFIFAVDHCFAIKGQGTVMTGTVLSGKVDVNDIVELPELKVSKKVKSMQMFRRPVVKAIQGDRVGICVTQFDPAQMERSILCTPGALSTITAAIAKVEKIRFFKGDVLSRARFHVSLGHSTVMCTANFFSFANGAKKEDKGAALAAGLEAGSFRFDQNYHFEDALTGPSKEAPKEPGAAALDTPCEQYALLEFAVPVVCRSDSMVIGSRLDSDIHSNSCRLVFNGRLVAVSIDPNYADTWLPELRIFKDKKREGVVDRLHDEYTVIGRDLFKKETQMDKFIGLRVSLSTGENGVIEGSFGQSGKFKVRIANGLLPTTLARLQARGKKGKVVAAAKKAEQAAAAAGDDASKTDEGELPEDGTAEGGGILITLNFKKLVFDSSKKMIQ